MYSSFIYTLTKLCYGTLRAVEVEQLTERAWFAITETCLAMTIFRDEIGVWFVVMFTALVTGKVWGWIGDGRVEFLEQQPPANPRLFHTRLSISLAASLIYDILVLRYTINSVIQLARPNMMVMFLFEFAVLTTCSWRTGIRYILSLVEQRIVSRQTQERLIERRQEVRRQNEALAREIREAKEKGESHPLENDPLPSEADVDEMDIEVPGWASKGEWVLWLDLITGKTITLFFPNYKKYSNTNSTLLLDMIKLGIYVAFFFMLLIFYGLPIHIMRDLLMTARDFLKRLNALLRYRRAIQEMNKYADATVEELAQENTCIICREDMRPWDPANQAGSIDRMRAKKLPCGHILHLGCLKSWLERQQVCPTCRSPVSLDRANRQPAQGAAGGFGMNFGGNGLAQAGQAPGNNNAAAQNRGDQNAQLGQQPQPAAPRIFNLGPIRFGFGANGQQVRDLAQQFGIPQAARNPTDTPNNQYQEQNRPVSVDNLQHVSDLLQQAAQVVHREVQALQVTQQELQLVELLMAELHRLHRQRNPQNSTSNQAQQPSTAFGQAPNVALPYGQLDQMLQQARARVSPSPNLPFNPTTSATRANAPIVIRQGTASTSTAIPAGSPNLPEGVVIPQGWSLLPLQRAEGATQQQQHQEQNPSGLSSSTRDGEASQGINQGTASQAGLLERHPERTGPPPELLPTSPTPPDMELRSQDTTHLASARMLNPTLAQRAHRFGVPPNAFERTTQPAMRQSRPSQESKSAALDIGDGDDASGDGYDSEASDEESEDSSEDNEPIQKGKAKAVTLEDTDDTDE